MDNIILKPYYSIFREYHNLTNQRMNLEFASSPFLFLFIKDADTNNGTYDIISSSFGYNSIFISLHILRYLISIFV